MKKSLIATFVAAPLLSLSSMAFAAEPMVLSAAQMDNVTAGQNIYNAAIFQANASPVHIVQLNVLTAGSGNLAFVASGNFGYIHQ